MPRKVGDVRLRYETSLLIGETQRRLGLWPVLALGVGLGCASGSVLVLLFPENAGPTLPLSITLAVLGGMLVMLSMGMEARTRGVRRFVLNFATESLRLEVPQPMRRRPSTSIIHFDAVRAVEVVGREGGRQALTVSYLPSLDAPQVRAELLVDGVTPQEQQPLERLLRMLRNAFGLKQIGRAHV